MARMALAELVAARRDEAEHLRPGGKSLSKRRGAAEAARSRAARLRWLARALDSEAEPARAWRGQGGPLARGTAEAARSCAPLRGGACSHVARRRRLALPPDGCEPARAWRGGGGTTGEEPCSREMARSPSHTRRRRPARAPRRRPTRGVAKASLSRSPSHGAAEAACSRTSEATCSQRGGGELGEEPFSWLTCNAMEAVEPRPHGGGPRARRPRLANPTDETRSLSQCEFQSRFMVLEMLPTRVVGMKRISSLSSPFHAKRPDLLMWCMTPPLRLA